MKLRNNPKEFRNFVNEKHAFYFFVRSQTVRDILTYRLSNNIYLQTGISIWQWLCWTEISFHGFRARNNPRLAAATGAQSRWPHTSKETEFRIGTQLHETQHLKTTLY
jgi:hypothetical protein